MKFAKYLISLFVVTVLIFGAMNVMAKTEKQKKVSVNVPESFSFDYDTGESGSRYLNVGLKVDNEKIIMTGCRSNVKRSCHRTWKKVFTGKDYAEFIKWWGLCDARERCEPMMRYENSREFSLSYNDIQETEYMPPESILKKMNLETPCDAILGIAKWFIDRAE